jgi:hypothetical protein
MSQFYNTVVKLYIYVYIYKGKAVPLLAWSGPEGSRKLRFPDYMTAAQDGGKVVSLMHGIYICARVCVCACLWVCVV